MPKGSAVATAVLAALGALAAASGCGSTEPCAQPLLECDGICVDVASDVDHCGRCGRACAGGLTCTAGQCVADPGVACTTRSGGAFVTLGACGMAVKTWITAPAFVTEAEAVLAGTAAQRVPVLDLLAGADCDDQWSFHVGGDTAAFADATVELCDGCPAEVQADLPYWLGTVKAWCPWSARVLAVDRRP